MTTARASTDVGARDVRTRSEVALRTVAEASALLAQSLDYEVTLANVARALVPALGDWCSVELLEGRATRPVAIAHVDPAKVALGWELRTKYPPRADDPIGVPNVLRTGRSELYPEIDDAMLAASVRDPEQAALIRDLGLRSAMVVPLCAGGLTLGALTLIATDRSYDRSDLALAEDVAWRAAMAVMHARAHRDAERQRARLHVLADTSRALEGAELRVDAVLERAAQAMSRALSAGVLVAEIERDETMVMRAHAHTDERVLAETRPFLGHRVPLRPGTPAAEVIAKGGGAQLFGMEGIERLQPFFRAFADRFGIRSLIIAPLRDREHVLGFVSLWRGGGAPLLDDDDRALAQDIADRAALAMTRAKLFEEQTRALERQRLLVDAGTMLAQSLEVGAVLSLLARLAVERFAQVALARTFIAKRAGSAGFAASEPDCEAALRAIVSAQQAPTMHATLEVIESGAGKCIASVDDAWLRREAPDAPHFDELHRLGMTSLLFVPLVARGTVLGVLWAARTRGAPFDDDDFALAMELGRRAGLAIDNARLFEREREAVAVRDEFLSIASHELNTPLTPLKMQIDTLRRGHFTPQRTAEKLDAAARQVTRLGNLVTELLDVSRICGGKLRLEPEPFDLADLVDEIVDRMRDEAHRAGSPLQTRIARPCAGSWDRLRVDQVVTNLLSNAIKYGGGQPIDVELAAEGPDRVRILVRDRGIGIAPEHQKRIFERFERAASARHYGGFGLGLWIARQVVEASGGTIAVESAPGQGSTFVVELPRRGSERVPLGG